ncbi:MAG: hypothetical protein O3A00_01720 [Planctomycetota bacterium]|nr:hypothetical protein [Planctomycetota bacterium]
MGLHEAESNYGLNPNSAIDRLLTLPAFDGDACRSDFIAAADECLRTLRKRFSRYAQFIDRRVNGAMESITALEQLDSLPPLFLPVLKSISFEAPADLSVTIRLSSSGTSGAPSFIPLDAENMQRRVDAMSSVYRAMNIVSGPMSAICFLMDPATTQMAGSIVIDGVLQSHPDVRSVQYLARMSEQGPVFDRDAAVRSMMQAIDAGPVLAVGYPALIAAAIAELKSTGTSSLPLPSGSLVLVGGGWKSFLPGVQLDQHEFRGLAGEFFHLPESAIRDMFGLSECPTVFLQCECGSYHVPSFARAESIDPETQRPVANGDMGLLQLTVPLTTSYPLLKILTTDKVVIDRNCGCGLPADRIIPHGRVSAARFETCAMKIGQSVV